MFFIIIFTYLKYITSVPYKKIPNPEVQGYYKVFRHLKCAIRGWLVHVKKNCIKCQILIGIIPKFSENFIQINQGWPQLKPQTWSEAILRIYTGLDHFVIDSLQKWILKAAIDRLEIQSWLKGEIVPT